MAHSFRFRSVLLIGFFLAILQNPVAAGDLLDDPAIVPAASLPWKIEMFRQENDSGAYPALAFMEFQGLPWMVFQDASVQRTVFAYPTDGLTSGEFGCGPHQRWDCRYLLEGDSTRFATIATHSTDLEHWRRMILYYQTSGSSKELRVSENLRQGSSYSSFGTCLYQFIGWETLNSPPSLRYDSNGVPHAAFVIHDPSIFPDRLIYARYQSPGGNCGDSFNWHCETVDQFGLGDHPALILTSTGEPRISYHADNKLIYAQPVSEQPGNCGTTGDWECTEVVSGAGNHGMFPSAGMDINTRAHLAFYEPGSGTLGYARFVGIGGNCGPLSWSPWIKMWNCVTIDTIGEDLTQVGISLDIDENNYPVVAYMSATGAHKRLKLAQPVSRLGGSVVPNCGPIEDLFQTWRCDTLDSSELDEGLFVSLKFSPNGMGWLGYMQDDFFAYSTNMKIAYQSRSLYLPITVKLP